MAPDTSSGQQPLISPGTSSLEKGESSTGSHPASSTGRDKKRTGHACDRCRLMRAKCTGGPRCLRCTKDDAPCVYGDHKRERNRKDLVESTARIQELESENRHLVSALRRITNSPSFRSVDHSEVMDLLSRYSAEEHGEDPDSRSRSQSHKSTIIADDMQSETGGESVVSSTIASPGHQGVLQRVVDLDHGTGAAGFIGKMSEMSWMQRCREYLLHPANFTTTGIERPVLDQHSVAAGNLTYFMDDTDLLAVDEDHIDSLQWPPLEVAVILAQAYFHTTQGAFEFIPRENFWETLYTLSRRPLTLSWEERRWLATANLVWAIGSKWLRLVKLNSPEFVEDHLIYYARARALGLDHRISFDHPDIGMVQGIGLLAFYLLTNGSITRAWNTVGNAVRHAMSLGLHLKVSDPSVDSMGQSRRSRVWFSLYKLQTLVIEITGRPQLVRSAHVTVPLESVVPPSDITGRNLAHMQSSQPAMAADAIWSAFLDASFPGELASIRTTMPYDTFPYYIRLVQISEQVADQLFTGQQDIPWSDTQTKISRLQQQLDDWLATLPATLKMDERGLSQENIRAKIQLAMYSCSVAMMIHRPCLCKIQIEKESAKSKDFNIWSARACVTNAISLLALLPEPLRPDIIHGMLPWWTLLHYLCQAVAVLILELCLGSQHFPDGAEQEQVVHAVSRGMAYLTNMTEESRSAYRACRIFRELLHRYCLQYKVPDVFDLNYEAMRPEVWTLREENDLLSVLRY